MRERCERPRRLNYSELPGRDHPTLDRLQPNRDRSTPVTDLPGHEQPRASDPYPLKSRRLNLTAYQAQPRWARSDHIDLTTLSIHLGAPVWSDSHSFQTPAIFRDRLPSRWPSWQ